MIAAIDGAADWLTLRIKETIDALESGDINQANESKK